MGSLGIKEKFLPGSLVKLRGREWLVETNSDSESMLLRPLGGSDEDLQLIIPSVEKEAIESAEFIFPETIKPGSYSSAVLLRDALRLKLRSGAGPFRSFGRIAVEPRAFQLVPLLMALKMPTVRLLIADDVGVGKTIEACLIVRELMDRGEIKGFSVLCPPHLIEQWQSELEERFHIQSVAINSKNIARLEREVPPSYSVFSYFPVHIISLDYIKSDRHKDFFLANAPECIIVDEAHTCIKSGKRVQNRFALLDALAKDSERHIIMLTATPHSGDNEAFGNLLSLIKPEFAELAGSLGNTENPLRAEFANHFVQRRRKDIEEWKDTHLFPNRLIKDFTYKLSGEWGVFFEEVRTYCLGIAEKAEKEQGDKARMMWYAALALLRCISSSPESAKTALSKRLDPFLLDEEIMDDFEEELFINDQTPGGIIEESDALKGLIKKAESLKGPQNDPKLARLITALTELINEGYKPVVFCRFIATAKYLAEELKIVFSKICIDSVTGELTAEERAEKVDTLSNEKIAILVATDCLSEGINLQHGFDAILHYDLAWNPTRHEQREGRVDRYGQKSKTVKCAMLYGEDNPVDGFILNVIIKKVREIKKELGVLVPMPDDEGKMKMALIKSALLKKKEPNYFQGLFDFDYPPEVKSNIQELESGWKDAIEKAKSNRTIFAQRKLKPEEVYPEWEKQKKALGGEKEVEKFTIEALTRLSARPEKMEDGVWDFSTKSLPSTIVERLEIFGLSKNQEISFRSSQTGGAKYIHRSHGLVNVLADWVLETALSDENAALASKADIARCGAFESSELTELTSIYLLRLRHQVKSEVRKKNREDFLENNLIAEESIAIAVKGRTNPQVLNEADAETFLDLKLDKNLEESVMMRNINESLAWYKENKDLFIAEANKRAEMLKDDHGRVRSASNISGIKTSVQACLPLDLIAVYVVLPSGRL
ncbi:MAG: DEAD/DEAH box helicase [Candidatus Riflebacteria bacterium]|jgi:superfamily II DNA or RNA helicase|nr:DEAD/DEAH box helicase [Candidatus Riflebacteria bacterium]